MHATDDGAETKVETIGDAGDVAQVRNWRKLRKPSDINEHEKAMRAFWAGDQGKQYGRVYVRSESGRLASSTTALTTRAQ